MRKMTKISMMTLMTLTATMAFEGFSFGQYYSNYKGYIVPKKNVNVSGQQVRFTSNANYYNQNAKANSYGMQQQAGNPSYYRNTSVYTSNNAPANYYNKVNTGQQASNGNGQPSPIIVVNNTQRMTNPIPGYGSVQNPYADANDSGFYLGLGFSNATDAGSGFVSDIQDQNIPGNWFTDENSLGKATAFSVSVGTQASGNMRTELSYSSYSGFQYSDYAYSTKETPDENGDIFDQKQEFQRENGGDVNMDAFTFQGYYSLENMMGSFMNGMIKPYVGFGFGLSFNKISSYTLYHEFYEEPVNLDEFEQVNANNCGIVDVDGNALCFTEFSDGTVKYQGGDSNNFTWNYEIGLTLDAGDDLLLDVFYRKSNFGSLSTGGDISVAYNVAGVYDGDSPACQFYTIDENGYCTIPDETGYFGVEQATESADLEITEVGLKLRTFF